MTLGDIADRIHEIRTMTDPERAHIAEDRLHRDVLAGIAAGDFPNARLAATMALTTTTIEFPRWTAWPPHRPTVTDVAAALDDATSLLVLMQPPGHNGDAGHIYGAKHLANRLARIIGRPEPFPTNEHGSLVPSDAQGRPLPADARGFPL